MSDHTNDLILVEHRDGCHVVRFLTESLFDPLDVATIDKQVHEVIEEASTPRVVLALDTVSHIASSTLSTLISIRSACQAKGGDAALAAVPATIMEILRIAKLDELFRIHEDVAQAIVALNE